MSDCRSEQQHQDTASPGQSPGQSPGTLLPCDSSVVAVLVTNNDRCLVAIAPIAVGTVLFSITGRETPTPTRYSLQVGATLHLDQDCARSKDEVVQCYFWRYMNHHCQPTVDIHDRAVRARRTIQVGEAITFDYNTTELDMAEPFACHCGSPECLGIVRGARHLSPAQRRRVADQLSPWLLDTTTAAGGSGFP